MTSTRALIYFALMGLLLCAVGCSHNTIAIMDAHDHGSITVPPAVVNPAPANPVSPTPVMTTSEDATPSETAQPRLNAEYSMDVVCNTDSELRIQKVTNTDTKTIVHMTFKAEAHGDEGPTPQIQTAAPGQATAFYIADPDTRAEYKLLNVEGIALQPSWTNLNDGDTLDFTLTFERIPDQLTRFHLIEGKTQALNNDGKTVCSTGRL